MFFFLQDFELQILLQLGSVSWYFPYTKEVFFFRRIFLLLVSITSGKTLRNSSWFFCSLVVFFLGGHQLPSAPPFPAFFFGLPKKNSWERNLYYENFGKPIEKSWLWKFHQWTWVVSLCPAEVGFDGKETVPRSYVTAVFRGWWVLFGSDMFNVGKIRRCFNLSKDGSGFSKKQDLDSKSSKMMRLNFACTSMIKTSISKLWMFVCVWCFECSKTKK